MPEGGRPILPLDASPLASAMSRCVALMDLFGNPFVDPATSRGSWHASPDGDPAALRAADVPSQAAGSVRIQARVGNRHGTLRRTGALIVLTLAIPRPKSGFLWWRINHPGRGPSP